VGGRHDVGGWFSEPGAAVDERACRGLGLAGRGGGGRWAGGPVPNVPSSQYRVGGRRLIAGPLGLSNLGCNFTVYLRP
jgi:hypothetical protein